MTRAMAALTLVLVLAGCGESSELTRFREACDKAGGITVLTRETWYSQRWDCVDAPVLDVPGFP